MIEITDNEFRRLSEFIKSKYGISLKEEKKTLVMGRLANVLAQKNFSSFSEYYDYVVSDKTGEASITLVDKISTNHTYFMREADHFDFFRDTVLPYLVRSAKMKDLRIWSAGCSTGKEPYTLAMIMDEYLGTEKGQWDTKILATDISTRVLEEASNGIYGNDETVTLPPQWKMKYTRIYDNNHIIIADRIRQEVLFKRFNLMSEVFPFRKKFHVIFCRNVMIYFDMETRRELVRKFYDMTESGGYLFVGHSESLVQTESKYIYIVPSVYRKI